MARLSVLIPCFNSETLIGDCLESVKWADEILVCDSFSRDRTLEICRRYTDRIVLHEYVNSAKQKNWAIPQCQHEWVLVIDTDERLEPELADEIRAFLACPPSDVDGCRIPRKNIILGQWLTVVDLWPDYQTRLFRRDSARYEGKEVHADVVVPGRIRTMAHAFIHHGTPTIGKQIGLLDRYTGYQADESAKQGRRFSWWRVLLRPPAAFLYYFFYRCGFRAGFRGFFLAVHAAVYSFYTYAKLWEIEERERQANVEDAGAAPLSAGVHFES